MPWIDDDRYLSQSEMENNANIIISYYRAQGIEDRTIAAILGNMQAESTLSPGLNERGDGGGYGLVQWTPKQDLIDACNTLGLSPYTSGDVQIQVIIKEILGQPASINQWYTTSGFISNYYNSGATSDMIGITGQQFLSNSMNWTPDKLAVMFMAGYERPSYNPNVNHYTQRMQNALNWYTYMGGQPGTFTPRLDDTGIVGDFHYYSQNPYYISGYGMPNCTCYRISVAFGKLVILVTQAQIILLYQWEMLEHGLHRQFLTEYIKQDKRHNSELLFVLVITMVVLVTLQ